MPFKLQLGDNAVSTIACAILSLSWPPFFIIVYVADFKERRQKAKKRRQFERSIAHAQKRKFQR